MTVELREKRLWLNPRTGQRLSGARALLSLTVLCLTAGCAEGIRDTGDISNDTAAPDAVNGAVSDRDRCIVQSVSDGDSMRCVSQGRVRLLLLDAPEMSQPPFGAQSRDALRRLVNRGDTVWLEYDVRRNDQYGRTLAHVWTSPEGGTHVNLAHAAGGWAVAVVFQPNVRYIEAIRRAVATARKEKRGLWADGQYQCEPIEHKRGNC